MLNQIYISPLRSATESAETTLQQALLEYEENNTVRICNDGLIFCMGEE